jgi:hypothetical protein
MYKPFKITLTNHPSAFKKKNIFLIMLIFGFASWLFLEADHSHPSIAEVKKDGAITSLPYTSSWRSV